jgi:hypothetical protein
VFGADQNSALLRLYSHRACFSKPLERQCRMPFHYASSVETLFSYKPSECISRRRSRSSARASTKNKE